MAKSRPFCYAEKMQKYFSIVVKLWNILKPFQIYFVIQLLLVFLVQLLSISTTVVNSHLINNLVSKNIQLAVMMFVLWIFIVVILNITSFLQNRIKDSKLDQPIAQYLQKYSLEKILNLTIEQHIEDHSSIKLQIISKGENAAVTIVSTIFANIIPTTLYTIVALVTLFIYSPFLAFVSVIVIIILLVWSFYFRKFHNPFIQENRDNWNIQNKVRTEAFSHLALAKYFGRESFFVKRYIANRAKIVNHHLITKKFAREHMFKLYTFRDVSELMSLGIAAYLFTIGNLPVGTLYLVLSVTSRIYWSIDSFSSALRDLPIWFLDVEKYLEAVDKEPSFIEDGEHDILLNEDIILRNVSFSYKKSNLPVLDSISFVIPKMKTTAFVGSSGSGKSTIIKLLMRAYQYHTGSIMIGNTELQKINASYLRKHIGYVEQHVDLLDETLRENILFGIDEKINETSVMLENVAKQARIDQFYHRLGEKKFETVVGERGIKLSGGERQRVGIARAIIKNPEILIFDEATSSLDSENEKYVMDAIAEVSKGKTTIIIAHRLSTVRDADKIIVMDKGRIVGEGTHDELMEGNEVYQSLVAHQV